MKSVEYQLCSCLLINIEGEDVLWCVCVCVMLEVSPCCFFSLSHDIPYYDRSVLIFLSSAQFWSKLESKLIYHGPCLLSNPL